MTNIESPNNAPAIMQLPDELLVLIFGYLDLPSEHSETTTWSRGDVRPTLCALALTCLRLSSLAREFMWTDVKLATGYISSFDPKFSTHRLRYFARSCSENPENIHRIKTLLIQTDFAATPDWGASTDDKAGDQVLRAVSQSSSLESLLIRLPAATYLQWLPSLFLSHSWEGRFARLQSVFLDCADAPIWPNLILCLCYLPSIERIETNSPIVSPTRPNRAMNKFIAQSEYLMTSKASNIRVISSTNLVSSPIELYQKLDKMVKIEEIRSSLPGHGLLFDDHDTPHYRTFSTSPYDNKFSPRAIQPSLESVVCTLRSLSMVSPRILVTNHDGSVIDLSRFQRLENLRISIHFFSGVSLQDARKVADGHHVVCKPQLELYRSLPPNLQTLEIHYDSDQGIFYDPHHLFAAFHIDDNSGSSYTHNASKEDILLLTYQELWKDRISQIYGKDSVHDRLDWLFEMLHVREIELPRLIEITIQETYARDWVWKDLDLLKVHPDLFRSETLELSIVLRVPRKWSIPEIPSESMNDDVQLYRWIDRSIPIITAQRP